MKNIFKKSTAVLMVLALLLSMAACSKGEDKSKSGNKTNTAQKGDNAEIGDTFVFCEEGYAITELGEVKNPLDPKEVYAKIDYIPEMFYGKYTTENLREDGDEAVKELKEDLEYKEFTATGEELTLSTLPLEIAAGPYVTKHTIAHIPGHHWMKVGLVDQEGNVNEEWAAYSISGDTLKLSWLLEYEYIEEKHIAKYQLSEETTEYKFKFEDTKLTLSLGDKSVTLTSETILDNKMKIEGYLVAGTEPLDDIDRLSFTNRVDDDGSVASYASVQHVIEDGEDYGDTTYNVYAEATKDGLFSITYQREADYDEEEYPTITHQFVYFYTGDVVTGGLVLTDGEKVYMYYDDRVRTTADNLGGEEADFSALSADEIAKLNQKKENLLADLAKAFEDKGIKVSVNAKTGEIAMDTSVLFGGDSAELSADGKKFLNKFIDVYTSIVYSEKYDGFVAKTMVEGHTAPVAGSTYEDGLPLSEERAKVVKDYCLSDKTGIDSKHQSKLKKGLEDVGYSNSKPVSDKKGNVDMEASRRVSFRFIINIEK